MLDKKLFKHAIVKLLIAWFALHKNPPTNILYYRYGVSNNQYKQLVTDELAAFGEAFKEFANDGQKLPAVKKKITSIKVTTVIVTKRHSTRFFLTHPDDAMKGNENYFPGTLVESVVTSPYYGDFYLQTQNAIKGTARPCHYFVIKNEMKIPNTELQKLVCISHASAPDYY